MFYVKENVPQDHPCPICYHADKDIQTEDKKWVGHIYSVADPAKAKEEVSHYFHRRCLEGWFAQRQTCPMCNASARFGDRQISFLSFSIHLDDLDSIKNIAMGAVGFATSLLGVKFLIFLIFGKPLTDPLFQHN